MKVTCYTIIKLRLTPMCINKRKKNIYYLEVRCHVTFCDMKKSFHTKNNYQAGGSTAYIGMAQC